MHWQPGATRRPARLSLKVRSLLKAADSGSNPPRLANALSTSPDADLLPPAAASPRAGAGKTDLHSANAEGQTPLSLAEGVPGLQDQLLEAERLMRTYLPQGMGELGGACMGREGRASKA